MVGEENKDYKALYNQALSDSTGVDGDMLAMLIEKYPYSQPLHYLRVRKQFKEYGTFDSETALLYAGSGDWLYGLILSDGSGPAVPEPEGATGDVPLTGTERAVDELAAVDISITSEGQPAESTPASDAETHITDEGQIAVLMADEPTADAVAGDADDEDFQQPADGRAAVVPVAQATPHEKVSLYHDEHLPYSFLWWLNKTRMEHAHTYQPYAPLNSRPPHASPATLKLDEAQLLDQQIRENIFHLQSPEEKLSDEHRTRTVSFQIPKKTDPVIERFIREEPQIKPPSPDKIDMENKARKSAEDQLTLVTETLAKIYAEQGLYPKAIAIYKKLSLKYPEKSAYFAAQIAELENKLK
ncbi:hypothetical protein SAMN05421747_111120 [Parapedobacter composti]|uniref:Tetratricopeptide repeat-containing protein n=1 Tax=Parapedobacter composti TaxID=623281 RepID=A0A1I1JK96_9SPHI|nr:hypothetical protein [Parapedobacter composti]SFC45880.1 hypothetical protein SAMN05421747_111120 [Parapedobacter composti]